MLKNNINLFLIIISALMSVTANSFFRMGLKKTGLESLQIGYVAKNIFNVISQPLVFVGFVLFGLSAIIWLKVLTQEPLNRSYPIFISLTILILILSSVFILKESLGWIQVGGMVLIVAGVILVFLK